MSALTDKHRRQLDELVNGLKAAAQEKLVSVLLYGPAAHGDDADGSLHVMIVLANLDLVTVREIAAPIQQFCKGGQPMPHLFTPALVKQAADVFPIEILDIRSYHQVLYGTDVVSGIEVDREHVRLQCERELREKMMRLVESSLMAGKSARALRELMARSVPDFARIFRGFLFLCGNQVPRSDAEVLAAFAERKLGDKSVFAKILDGAGGDIHQKFATYYSALTRAVDAVDVHDARHSEVDR